MVAMKSWNSHGLQRIEPTDFGHSLTVHLAPPSGKNVNLAYSFFFLLPNECKTSDIPIILSGAISVSQHTNTLN